MHIQKNSALDFLTIACNDKKWIENQLKGKNGFKNVLYSTL